MSADQIPAFQQRIADAVTALEALSESAAVRRHLAAALNTEGSDNRKLAKTAVRALLNWSAFRALLDECGRSDVRSIESRMYSPPFLETLVDPLFQTVMRKTIVCNLAIERFVTVLRRFYLYRIDGEHESLEREHLDIAVAVACQCFNNEYVYAVSPAEDAIAERLGDRLNDEPGAGDHQVAAGDLVVYAMYRPLSRLARGNSVRILHFLRDSQLNELIVRQVEEPREEATILADIDSFGMSGDAVTASVRQQYEESPYPRWFQLKRKERTCFSEAMMRQFPFLGPIHANNPVQILVAGCGTGQHPLSVASKYLDARVLAIDLSKASLAQAIRHARRLNLSNIEFRHGDLLYAERLQTQFDAVEAVGVLHHMADPCAGLRVLSGVLRTGGFMRIGLYSRRARNRLSRAKTFVESRLRGYSPAELRSMRQEVLEYDPEIPGLYRDLFYTSGFRDLLCHTHEVQFSPAELKPLLASMGLSFLGYVNVDAAIATEYKQCFPADPDMRDLELIESFEAAHPRMFWSMQVFCVRKEGGPRERSRESGDPGV